MFSFDSNSRKSQLVHNSACMCASPEERARSEWRVVTDGQFSGGQLTALNYIAEESGFSVRCRTLHPHQSNDITVSCAYSLCTLSRTHIHTRVHIHAILGR